MSCFYIICPHHPQVTYPLSVIAAAGLQPGAVSLVPPRFKFVGPSLKMHARMCVHWLLQKITGITFDVGGLDDNANPDIDEKIDNFDIWFGEQNNCVLDGTYDCNFIRIWDSTNQEGK